VSAKEKINPRTPKSLERFNTELAQVQMRGQWVYDEMLVRAIGGPKPAGAPYIWKWDMVHSKLLEACDVMPESYTARRSLAMVNPALPQKSGATHTIAMAMQMVRSGELAWAHRHSIAALRFVVKGNEHLFTVVDGEPCPMEDYDLILTPQWTWHDHHNESDDRVIWLDVLDVGLVLSLNATFYQTYPGDRQQPRRPSEADSIQTRAPILRPTWERPKRDNLPLRYPWIEAEAQLGRMARLKGSPFDGVSLEYTNPMTGGPALPTLACWLQMLRPGEETKLHRHTSSAVYFVIRGSGKTVVGETSLEWRRHDAFCLPNWSWHRHINNSKTEEAILFSVNDIPVLQAFGLYREEPEISLQMADAPPAPSEKNKRA
jgi:1-hydroxy-2-naphthoate dioxygenase